MKRLKFQLVLIFIATYIGFELCVGQSASKAKEKIALSTMQPFKPFKAKTTTTKIATTTTTTMETIPETTSTTETIPETSTTIFETSSATTTEEIPVKSETSSTTTEKIPEASSTISETSSTTTEKIPIKSETTAPETLTKIPEESFTYTTPIMTTTEEIFETKSKEMSTTSTSIETSSLTSAATSPISTTEAPIETDCTHTWKQYNPAVDRNAPMKDGVLAGLFYDGGAVYAGKGSAGALAMPGELMPGRLSVNSSEQPGVYIISYASEALDTTGNASYLFNNPAYNYEWVDISTCDGTNIVGWQHGAFGFVPFTRINLTEHGIDFSVIGFSYSTPNYTIYVNPVDYSMTALYYSGFEILTCTVKNNKNGTAKAKPKFCTPKWKTFDANNVSKIENEGVFAGYYNDSTPVYVGRGYDNCVGVTPARVSTRKGSKDPGIYTTCYNYEFSDSSSNAQYLYNDSKYTYAWFPGSANQFYLNSVAWNYSGYTFVVARVGVYLNDESDDQFITIGKVYLNQGTWYYNPINSKTEMTVDDIDILICTTDGSTEPIVKYGSGCVHKWKSYNPKKDPYAPAKYGIYVGQYMDDSPFYVGFGMQVDYNYNIPARLSVNGSFAPGAYVTSFGSTEYYYNKSAEYLVYNDSQLYEWKAVKYSDTVLNAVALQGQNGYYNFYVTRVEVIDYYNEPQDFKQMGFNYASMATYYFNPLYNGLMTATDIEVLVCTVKNPSV